MDRDSSPPLGTFEGARSCRENLDEDEALLARGGPAYRVAVLSDRAVSVGIGVREGSEALARIRGAGLPILRRSTGGTGVLHSPGDLAWSVVLPRGDRRIGADLSAAYACLGRGAVGLLGRLGYAAAWIPAPRVARDCCVLSGRGRVLVSSGRILGGAAQHQSARALLHHGTIFRAVDPKAWWAAFAFGSREEISRLGGIETLGIDRDPADTGRMLAEAIGTAMGPTAPG